MVICDKTRTAELLDYRELVQAVAQAVGEYESGIILSPERTVVPLAGSGVLLSMPAVAPDIAVHKLVSVQPANAARHLPTIQGTVTVADAGTGTPLCLLDGPEVTGRRTAAVSLLSIKTFLIHPPRAVLLFGTGVQASYHVGALQAVFPDSKILVKGLNSELVQQFCTSHRAIHSRIDASGEQPSLDVDVVITLTTSTVPVYNESALPGRLIIGVGAFKPEMAELGKLTLDGSDIYVDDPTGARQEAGDLLQAGIAWDRVKSLAAGIRGDRSRNRPVVVKSLGTAAWDLAASRVAIKRLGLSAPAGRPDQPQSSPKEAH